MEFHTFARFFLPPLSVFTLFIFFYHYIVNTTKTKQQPQKNDGGKKTFLRALLSLL
jgi:hypothetical protein